MVDRRIFIGACLVAISPIGGVAAEGDEDAAEAAAESWLKLVDKEDYGRSWQGAAEPLKRAIEQEDWVQMVGEVRSPLGDLRSRKTKSREYKDKAPTTRVIGGKVYTWGTGAHVIIQFDSQFAQGAAAVETVIVMKNDDGGWQVSGYSIH